MEISKRTGAVEKGKLISDMEWRHTGIADDPVKGDRHAD